MAEHGQYESEDAFLTAFGQAAQRLLVVVSPVFSDAAMLQLIREMLASRTMSDGSGTSIDEMQGCVTELALALERHRA